jgi:hypothetical protein
VACLRDALLISVGITALRRGTIGGGIFSQNSTVIADARRIITFFCFCVICTRGRLSIARSAWLAKWGEADGWRAHLRIHALGTGLADAASAVVPNTAANTCLILSNV